MSEPKLCKNCKHVNIHYYVYDNLTEGEFYRCLRPISVDFSLISGKSESKPIDVSCSIERDVLCHRDSCGPEGKYFEQRDTFWGLIQELFTDIYSIFIPTKTNV